MAIDARCDKTVKKGSWLAKVCGNLKLEIFFLVEIFTHVLISLPKRGIQLLNLLIELEMLFFDETHLHKSCLIPRLQSRVRLNQTFKLLDQSTQFGGTFIHICELSLK